jgi:hypothetical protein
MGTGMVQIEKIPEVINELDAFVKRIFPLMGGDDSLFDSFIEARKRMEALYDPSQYDDPDYFRQRLDLYQRGLNPEDAVWKRRNFPRIVINGKLSSINGIK